MSAVAETSEARRRERFAEIERELRGRWQLISRAVVRPRSDGFGTEAELHLDPALIRARAAHQGLADSSLAAAAESARVQRAAQACIEQVNATLSPEYQIAGFRIVS